MGQQGARVFRSFFGEYRRSILIDFLRRRTPPPQLQPPIYEDIDINCLALGRFYFSFAT